MLVLEAISVSVISVLVAIVLVKHGPSIDVAQLKIQGGFPGGIGLAIMFAVFSFVGSKARPPSAPKPTTAGNDSARRHRQRHFVSIFFIVATYAEILGLRHASMTLDKQTFPLGTLAEIFHAGYLRVPIAIGALCSAFSVVSHASRPPAGSRTRWRIRITSDGLRPDRTPSRHAQHRRDHRHAADADRDRRGPRRAASAAIDIFDNCGTLSSFGFVVIYAMIRSPPASTSNAAAKSGRRISRYRCRRRAAARADGDALLLGAGRAATLVRLLFPDLLGAGLGMVCTPAGARRELDERRRAGAPVDRGARRRVAPRTHCRRHARPVRASSSSRSRASWASAAVRSAKRSCKLSQEGLARSCPTGAPSLRPCGAQRFVELTEFRWRSNGSRSIGLTEREDSAAIARLGAHVDALRRALRTRDRKRIVGADLGMHRAIVGFPGTRCSNVPTKACSRKFASISASPAPVTRAPRNSPKSTTQCSTPQIGATSPPREHSSTRTSGMATTRRAAVWRSPARRNFTEASG